MSEFFEEDVVVGDLADAEYHGAVVGVEGVVEEVEVAHEVDGVLAGEVNVAVQSLVDAGCGGDGVTGW